MNKVASMSLKWCLFDKTEQTERESAIYAYILAPYKAYGQKTNVKSKLRPCCNIINLQRWIIKPHFIWDVYHTEFQFHPSSVVNVDIFYYFMFIWFNLRSRWNDQRLGLLYHQLPLPLAMSALLKRIRALLDQWWNLCSTSSVPGCVLDIEGCIRNRPLYPQIVHYLRGQPF